MLRSQLATFANWTSRKYKSIIRRVLILLLFLFVSFVTFPHRQTNKAGEAFRQELLEQNLTSRQQFKNILIWNSHDRYIFKAFGYGREAFVRNACPVANCRLLKNLSEVSNTDEIDAVVINVHHLYSMEHLPQFQRRNHQKFVLFTQEPPALMPFSMVEHRYGDIFNWTMTYRRNSEIVLKYGRVHRRSPSRSGMLSSDSNVVNNYAANKTKLAAWFVSHCRTQSRREDYAKKLQQYIPVDIYGKCGPLKCEKNIERFVSTPECYDLLDSTYKFYLSFENSLCQDYVTEKFYYILERKVIPVVYGSAIYEDIAPPKSFIDASTFTPKGLAEYLKLLDRNDTLYNEYFTWKKDYWVEAGVDQMMKHGFCELCQKLHEDQGSSRILSSAYLTENFSQKTQCEEPLRYR